LIGKAGTWISQIILENGTVKLTFLFWCSIQN
jgi:hypothetical protein